MFEELIIIVGFLLFSFLISYMLLTYTPEPLDKIVMGLAIIGIVIHELCHIALCVITHTKIESVNLISRKKNEEKGTVGRYSYFGMVRIGKNKRITFLQALLVGLAPLFLSFWLFFYLLEQLFDPQLNILLFFLYAFVMTSITLTAAPSLADVRTIPRAFKNDPRYSMYQIFLSALSILLVWVLINIYQLSIFSSFLIHEAIYYVLIMIVYYGFKYSFRGINGIIYKISSRNRRSSSNRRHFKRYTRRRFRTTKPRKLGKEEAHW